LAASPSNLPLLSLVDKGGVEFTNTLVSQEPEAKAVIPTLSEVVTLKPTVWGMSIDLLKAWNWLRSKWRAPGR
jgi:hypothetical protein